MLPDIKPHNYKRYIILFKREYDILKCKEYYVKYRGPNKLQIDVKTHESTDTTDNALQLALQLVLEFDKDDNVKSTINSGDPNFKKGLFYTEVLKPGRDNEAWQIIKQKYNIKYWIKKYIYFLLHAPVDIIEVLRD